MSPAAPEIRHVQIEPLSMRTELGHVMRLAMAIVVGVWLYLASALGGDSTAQRNLLPFQALVQSRTSVEQRMFREIQEGLLEAEARRSTTGAWPAVSTLATDGVPPFAADPTAKAVTYKWQLTRAGMSITYLGIPNQPGMPAWLVLVQEPEPGAPPDPAKEDEEHHRLIDGTKLHVSTWLHADGDRVAPGFMRLPQANGWTQLYAVGPARPAGGSATQAPR
jgi:hypothetical protein